MEGSDALGRYWCSCFDECEFKNVLVGNPYNKKMQRHTRYVYDYALYRQIIFGYSRKKKR